jgi:hypothetical protein
MAAGRTDLVGLLAEGGRSALRSSCVKADRISRYADWPVAAGLSFADSQIRAIGLEPRLGLDAAQFEGMNVIARARGLSETC